MPSGENPRGQAAIPFALAAGTPLGALYDRDCCSRSRVRTASALFFISLLSPWQPIPSVVRQRSPHTQISVPGLGGADQYQAWGDLTFGSLLFHGMVRARCCGFCHVLRRSHIFEHLPDHLGGAKSYNRFAYWMRRLVWCSKAQSYRHARGDRGP